MMSDTVQTLIRCSECKLCQALRSHCDMDMVFIYTKQSDFMNPYGVPDTYGINMECVAPCKQCLTQCKQWCCVAPCKQCLTQCKLWCYVLPCKQCLTQCKQWCYVAPCKQCLTQCKQWCYVAPCKQCLTQCKLWCYANIVVDAI